MYSRRKFLSSSGAVVAGAGLVAACTRPESSDGPPAPSPSTAGESEALFLPKDDLTPSAADRLDLGWSKARVRVLKDHLNERGLDGILLTDRWNIIYFTGLWHTTTERLMHAFISTDRDHPIWFYPALDRDLVRTWWYQEEDGEMYFDWHHAKGGFPNLGQVKEGPKVDLFRWVMRGLKDRGFGKKKLAVDQELRPSSQATVVDVLDAPMSDEGAFCVGLRMRKTPEELALTRRAYIYFDRIHAFARDYLLEHGTDLTDFEIANAAEKYGTDLIMRDIRRDGAPHTAVGINVGIGCRTGRGTAYPHPNQFHHNRVQRGDALQIAGVVRIGGCGGELYRPFMLGPRTDHMKTIWTVTRDACLMQKEESRAGVRCSEVAYRIHDFQVEQGVQDYIYHRPAHGEGMEGHQPPYLALGDATVLDPGMCFSVEPGLFDPQTGIGANFSDMFVVRPEGPSLQMSRLPWSEEYCWIDI
ncbi:MAG TPA: M24 family metallopeptidase [Woeseiaceae bacterium]|nr:M24 family metallopeptidase [Woeseiaceae bacterium]